MAVLADWKSATQQVGGLRYGCDARMRRQNCDGRSQALRAMVERVSPTRRVGSLICPAAASRQGLDRELSVVLCVM